MSPAIIVCPIEFSSADKAAVAQALSLARWHQAELLVVHVHSGSHRAASLHARLASFVDGLNTGGVEVTRAILSGDSVGAVVDYVRRTAADLVVVARHSRRKSSGWPAVTFAAAVGRAVPCPTIVVPVDAQPDGEPEGGLFRNIVCAVDFSNASISALNTALRLAQESGGRIRLLHVLEGFPFETIYSSGQAGRVVGEYRARVEQVNVELRRLVPPEAHHWCEVESETVSGVAADAIAARAKAGTADLLVVGMPRRNRLDHFMTGSTVKKILRGASCSVLLVPGLVAAAADQLPPPIGLAAGSLSR